MLPLPVTYFYEKPLPGIAVAVPPGKPVTVGVLNLIIPKVGDYRCINTAATRNDMDKDDLAALEEFFKKLPRPLPDGLSIYPGVLVKDPEAFIRANFNLIKSGEQPGYAYVCYDRLLLLKAAYIDFMES